MSTRGTPGMALICIDTQRGRIARYSRNALGKVESSHEYVVEKGSINAAAMADIERLRVRPRIFETDHIPEGAA